MTSRSARFPSARWVRCSGIYQTPDLEGYTDYTRPYLATLHEELIAAGQAGATGVVFAFDVPGKQVRGYYDPHVGTLYRVPAVFVGSAQATRLKALAAQGSSARVTVLAKIARKKTRNLIARLPGQSSEKIVLAANTDGNSWVQENGVIGMLAFARYYAKLPKRCHPRTLELVFSSAHDGFRDDGLNPDHYPLDKKKTAFAFTIEHLGTREILPTGEGAARRLKFTGRGRPGSVRRGRQRCPAPDGGRGDQAPKPSPHRGAEGARGPRTRARRRRSARWAASATRFTRTWFRRWR